MSTSDWADPPERLDLPAGVADVWRAEVAGRQAARTVLRRLLGAYLSVADPATIRLEPGPHGKPALAGRGGPAAADLRFNMSHTRGLALYAFARGAEVGVDVERPGRSLAVVRLAGRFIGAEEAERLQRLPPQAQEAAFLRAWARYEAMVKCLGTGIAGHAAQRAGQPAAPGDGPWVAELDPGGGAAAAVAVAGGPRPLRLWRWREGAARPSRRGEAPDGGRAAAEP